MNRGHKAAPPFIAFTVALLALAIHGSVLAFPVAPYFPLVGDALWSTMRDGVHGFNRFLLPFDLLVNGYPTKPILLGPENVELYYSNDNAGIRLHRELYPEFVPGCGYANRTFTYSPPVSYAPGDVSIGTTYSTSGTVLVQEGVPCGPDARTGIYTVTSSVVGIEKVSVPAGTFEALKFVVNVNVTVNGVSNSETQTFWLAPQVGIVRAVDSTGTEVLVTTSIGRTRPDPFSFNAVLSSPLGSQVISNAVTVTGTTRSSPITITGGEYRIDDGLWITTDSTVSNGQVVHVRTTTPNIPNSSATAILTIGGVSAAFTVNSPFVADTTPDAFGFTPQTKVASSTSLTSDSITVSGINVAVPVSISGGSYSVNGGPFTTLSGTVNNGDSVIVQLTSSSTDNTRACAIVRIGGVDASFCATTGPLGVDLRQLIQLLLSE